MTQEETSQTVEISANESIHVPEEIPIMPLREMVIFPRMILPMIFNGGGFYFGYGSGGAYVSSTTTMVQGDFTGGLIVVLGN